MMEDFGDASYDITGPAPLSRATEYGKRFTHRQMLTCEVVTAPCSAVTAWQPKVRAGLGLSINGA